MHKYRKGCSYSNILFCIQLSEQLRVASGTVQHQNKNTVNRFINQQPIRFNMTFAATLIVSQQIVVSVLGLLKTHIGMGLTEVSSEDKSIEIQIRIAEIDIEFKKMLSTISTGNEEDFDDTRATELMNEKQLLTKQLEQYTHAEQKRESAKSRLDEIYTIIDSMKNHSMEYDDRIVRQIIECVVAESKEKVRVVFVGGLEVEEMLDEAMQ